MAEGDREPGDLGKVVVKICPACGVVNPSGPGEACSHLQLARFDGVDPALADLLREVADARGRFDKLVAALKTQVREAIRSGGAEVERPPAMIAGDLDLPGPRTRHRPLPSLSLEHPEQPAARKPERRRGTRSHKAPTVDPRQLELIARQPPKGDA